MYYRHTQYSGISKCSEVICKIVLDMWLSMRGTLESFPSFSRSHHLRSILASLLSTVPVSVSDGYLGWVLYTVHVECEQAVPLCVSCAGNSPLPLRKRRILAQWPATLSLGIACCAGSEWVQFTIQCMHQVYSVGTDCHHNHQRWERSSEFDFYLKPSFSPAPTEHSQGHRAGSVQIHSMYSMLVPALALV